MGSRLRRQAPLRADFVRLGERREVSDRPGDDVAVAVQVAFALVAGAEHAGDVAGDGGLLGDYGDLLHRLSIGYRDALFSQVRCFINQKKRVFWSRKCFLARLKLRAALVSQRGGQRRDFGGCGDGIFALWRFHCGMKGAGYRVGEAGEVMGSGVFSGG